MTSASLLSARMWAFKAVLAVVVVSVAFCVQSQSTTGQAGSPREVVQLLRNLDSHGERLTDAGWVSVSALFVRPEARPRKPSFLVVTDEVVGDAVVKGGQAEVWTESTDWGTVDRMARFSRVVGRATGPAGLGDAMQGPIMGRHYYRLVLTGKYWALCRDGVSLQEVNAKPAWRIEVSDPQPRVSIDAAIRYLTTLSSTSSDPTIRKNAVRSIAAIKGLRQSSSGLIH
jgi:hypothetical protein